MKKSGSFIYAICCLLVLLTGCKEDDMALDRPDYGPAEPMNAIFELNLAFDKPAHSRMKTNSTPGNAMECKLNRLYLFAVPYEKLPDGDIQEDWKRVSWTTTVVPERWENPVRVPINLITTGTMKVYVGANLSKAQAEAFIRDRVYTINSQEKETYYQSINEFAPFLRREDHKEKYYRQSENIAMFCQKAGMVDTTVKTQKTEGTKPVYDVEPIYLQRMVAKVLVTCQTKTTNIEQGDENGVNYVELKGELTAGNEPQGWIRQKNVHYFINNMPRKTEFMLRYEDTNNDGTKELKAHYNLKEIFNKLIEKPLPLIFNNQKIKEHFIHYELLELFNHEKSFKPSEVWNENTYHELITSPTNPENLYNKEGVGMYTLENLFELKTTQEETELSQAFSEDEMKILWSYEALPIITQVSIAAKFVPKYIYMTKEEWEIGTNPIQDMDLKINDETKKLKEWIPKENIKEVNTNYLSVTCPNETVAQTILTKSIMRKNKLQNPYIPNQPNLFPDDTFFTYTRTENLGEGTVYCTYGVATSFGTVGEVDKTMVPYPNGWGYYYTYINSEDSQSITSADQLKNTYILRNTYYILKVTGISQLGSTVSDPNYMRVHTLKAAWQDGGSGGITLN